MAVLELQKKSSPDPEQVQGMLEALRLKHFELNPYLNSNPRIREIYEHTLNIVEECVISAFEYNYEFKDHLVLMLNQQSKFSSELSKYLEKKFQEHGVKYSDELNSVIDNLSKFETAYTLATYSNRDLSCNTYKLLETELSYTVTALNSHIQTILNGNPPQELAYLMQQISRAPERMRALQGVNFLIDENYQFKSGDYRDNFDSSYLVEKRMFNGQEIIEVVKRFHGAEFKKEQYYADDYKNWLIENQIALTRGGYATNIACNHNRSDWQNEPIQIGHSVRFKKAEVYEGKFGLGIVIGYTNTGDFEVLYYKPNGAAEVFSIDRYTSEFEILKDQHTAWHKVADESLLQNALINNPHSSFTNMKTDYLPHPDLKTAEHYGAYFYNLRQKAEIPLAVHVIGFTMKTALEEAIDSLKEKVALFSESSWGSEYQLPSYPVDLPNSNFSQSVLIILARNSHYYERADLINLVQQGFKIIIESRDPELTKDLDGVIALNHKAPRACVNQMQKALELLSEEVNSKYTDLINVKNVEKLPNNLAEALDLLSEQNPLQALSKMPSTISFLNTTLKSAERENLDYYKLLGLNSDASVTGTCKIYSELSVDQIKEFASLLAISYLDPEHPAVAIRGITLPILTPQLLEQHIADGAQYITLNNPDDEIKGILIAFPPQTTEKLRPGLSSQYNLENKLAYTYWIWLHPDHEESCKTGYTKLMNSFFAQQLCYGATAVFAKALDRNMRSIRAAMTIADVKVLSPDSVNGSAAVILGIDLVPDPNKVSSISARAANEAALDILIGGPEINRDIETLNFLQKQYSFITQFIDLENLIANKNNFELMDIYRELRSTLHDNKSFLRAQLIEELEELLMQIHFDDLRESAISTIRELISNSMQESPKELRQHYSNIYKRMQILGKDAPAFKETEKNYTEPSKLPIPDFPITESLEHFQISFQELSERTKEILDRIYGDGLSLKVWYPSESRDSAYRFDNWRNRVRIMQSRNDQGRSYLNSWNLDLEQVAPTERQHYHLIQKLVDWYNQVAQAGRLNHKFNQLASEYFNVLFTGKYI